MLRDGIFFYFRYAFEPPIGGIGESAGGPQHIDASAHKKQPSA